MSDKILTSIYYDIHILPPVISKLLNMSINEISFPSCFKTVRFLQIFNTGKKSQTTNYTPVSTLPAVAKEIRDISA